MTERAQDASAKVAQPTVYAASSSSGSYIVLNESDTCIPEELSAIIEDKQRVIEDTLAKLRRE